LDVTLAGPTGPTVKGAEASSATKAAITVSFDNVGAEGLSLNSTGTGFEICAIDPKNASASCTF
jgi:hypothetical protein